MNGTLFFHSQEQTRQHAVTIVAMEDRLMRINKQNKQLEIELNYAKQQLGGKYLWMLLIV